MSDAWQRLGESEMGKSQIGKLVVNGFRLLMVIFSFFASFIFVMCFLCVCVGGRLGRFSGTFRIGEADMSAQKKKSARLHHRWWMGSSSVLLVVEIEVFATLNIKDNLF